MATTESTATLAVAIKEYFEGGFLEGVYRNDQVLAALRLAGMTEGPGSGEYIQWHVNNTGNTSVGMFTENDPAPASVAQGWVRAKVGWNYYWGWVTITGIARDVLRAGGNFDALEAAMVLTMRDIVDFRSSVLLGSTNNGILQAVSASATYAGITRGASPWFESSTSTTATLAGLRALHRTCRSPDKGGRPNIHLVSPTVMEWYAGLVGLPAASGAENMSIRVTKPADGSPTALDLGVALSGMRFYGAPVVEVPDLLSSVWIGLDGSGGNITHRIIRPFEVKFHGNSGDNEVYEISTGSALAIMSPKWDMIMTGI